jgi:hypothetical protein
MLQDNFTIRADIHQQAGPRIVSHAAGIDTRSDVGTDVGSDGWQQLQWRLWQQPIHMQADVRRSHAPSC